MMLAINAGNTRVTFAVFRHGRILARSSLNTKSITARDISASLEKIIRIVGGKESLRRVLAASVVPKKNKIISRGVKISTGLVADFVSPGDCRLKIDYDKNSIGIDRLINAFAAREIFRVPAIVVDAGTCITFDGVTSAGEYVGGPIIQGLRSSVEGLSLITERIGKVDFKIPKKLIAKNTAEAVRAGAFYGIGGAVDAILEKMIEEMGCRVAVIATGGDALLLKSSSITVKNVFPDLTLFGLQLL